MATSDPIGASYFEQLDEAWVGLRIEIEDYRELGERVVALGVVRAAGMSSQLVDSYGNRKDALEAAGLPTPAPQRLGAPRRDPGRTPR
jgi:hypothetical protein